MKRTIIFFWFISVAFIVSAQDSSDNKFVKSWHISSHFAEVDSIPMDTMHINYHLDNLIDRFSIANSYNGNLGSPLQSKLYFDRPFSSEFIFANAYYPYIKTVENTTFYNTKTPFSNLSYNTGGTTYREEDHIKFLFTANANKNLNFGTTLDYIYAPGEYGNQSAKRFSGSLFGSYTGKHYSATGVFATNDMANYENGGVVTPTDINSSYFQTKDIPTNITGYTNYKYNVAYYNHQYNIGIERPIRINDDSVRMEYVPVTRFTHTFKFEDARKRYFENSVERAFYKNTYLDGTQTNDSSALQTLTNTISISMEEEFNKWLQFGLTAFIENDIERLTFNTADGLIDKDIESNTKLGGILSKQRGKLFKYNILGEMFVIGHKAGDFLFEGNVGGYFKLWNDSISLVANGFIRSDKPSHLLQKYYSNHFRWENDFDNIYKTHIGGEFSIPTRSFSIDLSVENLTKYIYFNNDALPAQFDGNIQVLAANLKQDFHVGKFTLENNVVYQLSSQKSILPLPMLTLFHNLYYHDKWHSHE